MSKVLVITGGSKGIGLATARHFSEQGYRVVNLSRTAIPLDKVIQIHADLSDINWPQQYGTDILEAVGDPDSLALVHNAASLKKDSVRDLDALSLQAVLQLNVIALVQLNQLLVPRMKPGSSILYVGSTLSEKAVSGSCSYVTSKHAVVGLMRSTCQDLAGSGIHTACICPGFTDTEMLRAHVGQDQSILDSLASGVTFGRLIRPEEIADTLWCAANSPVLNGAVIHANLGQIES